MQNISRYNVVSIEKTTLFIKKTGSKGETILRGGDRRRKKIIKDGQLITRSETEDRRVSQFSSLFVLVRIEPDLVAPVWSTAASAPLNHAPRQEQSVLHPASRRRIFHFFSAWSISLRKSLIRRRFLSEKAE